MDKNNTKPTLARKILQNILIVFSCIIAGFYWMVINMLCKDGFQTAPMTILFYMTIGIMLVVWVSWLVVYFSDKLAER